MNRLRSGRIGLLCMSCKCTMKDGGRRLTG
jgi:hypothetical protein